MGSVNRHSPMKTGAHTLEKGTLTNHGDYGGRFGGSPTMTIEPTNAEPPALAEPEYDAIEQAVMETDRGRWFLREFARRNRHAETERLLEAIARLERNVVAKPQPDGEVAGMRRAICEMAEEIAKAKKEIAAIRPTDGDTQDIADATAELDAIVTATESATSDILGAAEQIQEIAWTLREQNVEEAYCEAMEMRATEIYTACSFQDITGQRTTKVVRVLQMLDTRINTMAELWGGVTPASTADKTNTGESDQALLNGPALEGEGMDQDDVDRMMAGDFDVPGADESGDADVAFDTIANADDADVTFDTVADNDDVAETAAPAASDVIAADSMPETSDATSADGDDGGGPESDQESVDAMMEADFAAAADASSNVADETVADAEALAALERKDYDALFS